MNRSPKVSVIIPVYNVEKYLRECLDSIIGQSLKDIEIICVNDGSTDGSMAILEEYSQKDDRIIIVNQENSGAGAARNNGLQYAKGKYLSLLDGDDFFHKNMLLAAVEKAESVNAQIVMYRTQQYLEADDRYVDCPWTIKTEYLPQKDVFSPEEVEKNFFFAILGYTWDKLFLTEYVKSNKFFFQEQPVFNDAFFVYTALLKAQRIALVDQCLCTQRKRQALNSITDRRSRFTDCAYSLMKGIKGFLDENNLIGKYRQDFSNYAVHLFTEDLKGKSGINLQKEISSLRTKWMKELDLIQPDEYYYNKKQYQKLFNAVYGDSNLLDLSFSQGIDNIVIPVVFATDYNYLKYTLVSMCSILRHPTINITYRFIILIPEGSIEKYRELIDKILSEYNNYTIEILEIGDEFNNAYLKLKDITTPTYYRLLLPELLPDCDKCIYMDGDTIVLDDLFNLYSIDMGNNYVGAAEAPGYYENKGYHMARLGIPPEDEFKYYNAGVILINLRQMREDNITDKFMGMISNKLESQDQDIINIVCRNRIVKLSAAYNVMTKYNAWSEDYFINVIGQQAYDVYKHQVSKPVIIHYADKVKPWHSARFRYADHWWRVTMTTACWNLFSAEKTDLLLESIDKSERAMVQLARKNTAVKSNAAAVPPQPIPAVPKKKNSILNRILKKIRGGIRCFRENGLVYTVKRLFIKIKNKLK